MKTFDEIIVQLIIQHDCVVIPEFGGFVTKAIPSKIDYDKGIMSPPSKQLLFNIQLLNNDGLLTTEISSVNKTSYADASNEIIRKVSEYNTVLKEGKKITIHKVGTFQRNQEGVIIFEQDRFFNFLMASYGLDNIQFVPAKEITKEIILTPRKSNKWKYAAAACLFPIAFYSFWIPLKTNVLSSRMISINDLNPFHKAHKINYLKKPLFISDESDLLLDKSIEEQRSNADLSLDFWYYEYDEQKQFTILNEPKEVEIIDTEDKEVIVEDAIVPDIPNQIDIITPFTYNCIAGCFSNYTNATRLVKELKEKGYDASILPGGKFYQVSLGGGFSREAVYSIKANADQDSIPVWILH